MKIVSISDLHANYPKSSRLIIPACDVLCVAGDICGTNRQKEDFELGFMPWAQNLLDRSIVKDVVMVAGNHDWYFEEKFHMDTEKEFRDKLPPHFHYLRDSSVVIDGVKFYGIPWTIEFYNWAFMVYEGEMDKICEKIPTDTDVIVVHGPPFGFNDVIEGQTAHLGARALAKHIQRVAPQLVVFGHIHSGSHIPTVKKFGNRLTTLNNVSLLNEDYKMVYPPYEYTINKEGIQ